MSREKSRAAFARAKTLLPGGVNSPARAFGGVGGDPIFIGRAEGPCLFDLDGNRYLDYVLSWGPMILGHGHPGVLEAITQAARNGTSFGAPTEAESELAELVIEAVPSVEKVRLVNSGTEAAMSAVRLARGFTGRNRIVKFAGNYHGHVDSLLVAAGSSAATLGVPNSPGVTPGATQDTLILRYNDPAGVEEAFARYGSEIAGVIVEPVAGNMGCVVPQIEFLRTLREQTQRCGALLIFDEVITGFRVAYGGAQARFGVTSDLSVLGKILGGGLPLGAYGGRRDIMDHVLPAGKVFQAGTLSGNPLAVAAGIATLKILRGANPYPALETMSQRLVSGLKTAAAATGIPHRVGACGAMLTFFFSNRPVTGWDSAAACDTKRFARFFWGLLDRGFYLPCSQFEALFLSIAHTESQIDQTISAAAEVLRELSAPGA
jgi:glutamate-1-semialdehyde 2,1-aminomutase